VLRTEIEDKSLVITVGFNHSQMHDPSAYIDQDGELLFAVAEERISRIKNHAGFQRLAACLDFTKVRPDRLDFICQRRLRERGHN
jgi:predicted NodU family carbamoyl transferase